MAAPLRPKPLYTQAPLFDLVLCRSTCGLRGPVGLPTGRAILTVQKESAPEAGRRGALLMAKS